MHDYKHLRRSSDKEVKPKTEWWAFLALFVLSAGGTTAYLVILADSI